jgi:hypothetical protein
MGPEGQRGRGKEAATWVQKVNEAEESAAQELLTSQQKVRENAERHHGVMLVNMRRERKQALANWRDRLAAADAAQKRQLKGWARIREAVQSASQQSAGLNNVIFQGAQAIEDFGVGFQLGGLQGGIRGAANNIGFILNQLSQQGKISPFVGAFTTIGLTIGSTIIPAIMEWTGLQQELDKLIEDQNQRLQEGRDLRSSQTEELRAQLDLEQQLASAKSQEEVTRSTASLKAKELENDLQLAENDAVRENLAKRRAALLGQAAALAEVALGENRKAVEVSEELLRIRVQIQNIEKLTTEEVRARIKLEAREAEIANRLASAAKRKGELPTQEKIRTEKRLNDLRREYLVLTGRITKEEARASELRGQFGARAGQIAAAESFNQGIKDKKAADEKARKDAERAQKEQARAAQREEESQQKKAESVAKSLMTPFELFQNTVAELRANPFIDPETLRRGILRAQDVFIGATGGASARAQAQTLGFDQLAKQIQNKALENNAVKQTRLLQDQLKLSKKQLDQAEKNGDALAKGLPAVAVAS